MERTDDESNKQPVILPPMIRIAYCTPSLHIPGGVERVLTTKANYLAENGNYDIYILLTDGKGKPPCYTLSPKVKIIQLDIDFEELLKNIYDNKSKIENAINHITSLQEKLCYCENNLQYIKRLQALKYWLHKFDSFLDRNSRQHGEYAAVYESYFHTCCGFSFYDRVCNSILVYEYGDRPF